MKLWVAATAACLLSCSSCSFVRREPLPDLPRLEMAGFLPAIREEVQKAYSAAKANPDDPKVVGELGMILHAYQQRAAAELCYRRAHGLNTEEFRWRYYLGVVQAEQGRHEEAVASLRDALKANPTYLPARLRLADSLLETSRLKEAQAAYQKVIRADSNCAAAYYGFGRVQAAAGDLAAAVESFRKSVELFPDYGPAQYALALAYRRLGKEADSRAHFQLAEMHKATVPPAGDPLVDEIRKRNAGALALIRQGTELAAKGNIEQAIQAHLKALEADPSVVQAHVNLISLYGRLGQVDKAEQHYRAAIHINANLAECHYNYGVLLFAQHDSERAKQAFQRALEINPRYARAHNSLGYLLEEEGKESEALRHYRLAVESQPDYRLARFHLGRLLVKQRKYHEAIEHLRRTLSPQDEQTPTFLYALGAAYAMSGDRSNALTSLLEARKTARSFGQSQLLERITHDLALLQRGEGTR